MYRLLLLPGALLMLVPLLAAAEPAFDSPPSFSRDGGFTLQWETHNAIELEMAAGPDFADARLWYTGSDTQTVVSGLPDGDYRFRLRSVGASDWADETRVTVEHHSLARAFGFFTVGALVFLILIASILKGPR